MDKFSFSRFSEKRNYKSTDTAGYDEYVEGVEPDETASLETHIGESNMGYRLVQKMGWKSGSGLGREEQGRREPIPFELKDDNMGLGRWSYEVVQAQDATEKRKQMEMEKEVTSDLVEKYKTQAEKEEKLAGMIYEMNKSFYCELCDKQYFKYSEYDNHINSYDHHHRQRLKDLKQWETGRKFAGHREEEEKKKLKAAYNVAVERAHMLQRQARRKQSPAFKPIGSDGSATKSIKQRTSASTSIYQGTPSVGPGVKRSNEAGEAKAPEKKGRFSKYGGLNFQSAGNLVTVGIKTQMKEDGKKGRGYDGSVKRKEGEESSKMYPRPHSPSSAARLRPPSPPSGAGGHRGATDDQGDPEEDEGSKFSFGFSKNKKPQYRPRGATPPKEERVKDAKEKEGEAPGPPPLMSRRRELMTKAFGGDSDSEGEEEGAELVKMAIRGTPRFMFQIRK